MKKAHKQSSTIWLKRRHNDSYVAKSRELGFRSRAAFKLIEINKKYKILSKKTSCVIDLGCSPGSWIQVTLLEISKEGIIIGLDRNKAATFDSQNVSLIVGDFEDPSAQDEITSIMKQHNLDSADVILSDMAENSCGDNVTDHIRIANLIESVLQFSKKYLKKGGTLVTKLLHGMHENRINIAMKQIFKEVSLFKPHASYKDSSEIFIVCKDKR